MIVVESNEMQNLERATARSGMSLATLMEQAGAAVAELAAKIITEKKIRKVAVLCGKGQIPAAGFNRNF